MNFGELMARAMREDDDGKPTILPEAAIMRLREFATIYAEFPSFKPGDIVTPRKDGTLRGAGEPNIVLEVAMHATPLFDAASRWQRQPRQPAAGSGREDLRRQHRLLLGRGPPDRALSPAGRGSRVMAHPTPAPWSVHPVDETRVIAVASRDEVAVVSGDYSDRDDALRMAADARLIAAAPDMLQAGKHLAVKLAEVYRAAGQSPGSCQALRDWMDAASRAEGRQ